MKQVTELRPNPVKTAGRAGEAPRRPALSRELRPRAASAGTTAKIWKKITASGRPVEAASPGSLSSVAAQEASRAWSSSEAAPGSAVWAIIVGPGSAAGCGSP
ncbi:hypothetical protein [Streptomyces sp. NPDC017435]|uniref:hypothetical protein n=1 Tax=Streptomyces sp. NPDC017435 TaxID=3364995 RepID=UPI0037AF63BF